VREAKVARNRALIEQLDPVRKRVNEDEPGQMGSNRVDSDEMRSNRLRMFGLIY